MRELKGVSIQPIGLLIIVVAAIFATSAFVELLLSIFSPLSIDLKHSLLVSGLTVVVLFPVIYYLVYEPLTSSIKSLARSEEALQESEEKFRSLVETTDNSIYVVNRNCEYLFMNAKHRARLGLVFDESYRGKAFSDFHTAEDSVVFREKVKTVFNTGEPLQQELRSMRDGRYFLRTLSPIKGQAKEVRAVSIVSKDITRLRKESEAERRYRAVFEQSPFGILIIDINGDIIEFNETARLELGYSKEEFAKLSLFDINPQSKEKIQDRIKEVLNKGSHEFEVQHKTKDGEIRDVSVNTRVLDLFGRRVFQAIWKDITERKRYEKELELHGQILAYMAEGVLLIRATDGVIVYTNPKLEKMFGYGHNELVGHHVSLLNAPSDRSPEETVRHIMDDLHQNGIWKGEILNIKKDGTPFWSYAAISAFEHHMHGSVWIAIHQDITDRKSQQKAVPQV